MAQNIRVATFIPTTAPSVGDSVFVLSASAPKALSTEFNIGAAGGTIDPLPVPTTEGDVLQADAGLDWIPLRDIDSGRI